MAHPMVRLADCCEIVSGATPKTDVADYWGGEILWVTPKDIAKLDSPYLSDTPDKITASGFKSCSTQMLPAGAILVSSRAPIGHVAIAGKEMCTNQGFKSLVPGPSVHSGYLYHCMKFNAARLAILGNGATFKEVSKGIVEDFEIPLPADVNEQRRLSAILDKADTIRRKRREALKLADEFLRAAFLDLFGDPVSNSRGFPRGTIRDLVTEVRYGSAAKADESEGRYPMLRMNNLTYQGELDLSSLKYVDLAPAEEAKYLAQRGDLLFNRTNSKELVGKTVVFDCDEPMAIAGYLIRVRTENKASTYYISGYLNSAHGKKTLMSMCKSIVGMANINAQELQDIPILLPPDALQERYAAIVARIRKIQATYRAHLNEANSMFDGLSHRAFQGAL